MLPKFPSTSGICHKPIYGINWVVMCKDVMQWILTIYPNRQRKIFFLNVNLLPTRLLCNICLQSVGILFKKKNVIKSKHKEFHTFINKFMRGNDDSGGKWRHIHVTTYHFVCHEVIKCVKVNASKSSTLSSERGGVRLLAPIFIDAVSEYLFIIHYHAWGHLPFGIHTLSHSHPYNPRLPTNAAGYDVLRFGAGPFSFIALVTWLGFDCDGMGPGEGAARTKATPILGRPLQKHCHKIWRI